MSSSGLLRFVVVVAFASGFDVNSEVLFFVFNFLLLPFLSPPLFLG